jgi:hypothetical protein
MQIIWMVLVTLVLTLGGILGLALVTPHCWLGQAP